MKKNAGIFQSGANYMRTRSFTTARRVASCAAAKSGRPMEYPSAIRTYPAPPILPIGFIFPGSIVPRSGLITSFRTWMYFTDPNTRVLLTAPVSGSLISTVCRSYINRVRGDVKFGCGKTIGPSRSFSASYLAFHRASALQDSRRSYLQAWSLGKSCDRPLSHIWGCIDRCCMCLHHPGLADQVDSELFDSQDVAKGVFGGSRTRRNG